MTIDQISSLMDSGAFCLGLSTGILFVVLLSLFWVVRK